jgi:proline iminopeptidase
MPDKQIKGFFNFLVETLYMKTLKLQKLILVPTMFLFLFTCENKKDNANERDLWPEIEPFQTGYLKVSDIHEIYYELCGNIKGTPVFVIHGGPGMGCSPYMRRFFDPEKYLIVLHDQRGAGKSKPNAELRENTTQNLVEDIEQLRIKLKADKIILFGGSWGTTLSLAYAEKYPEHVSHMVLRGIFLGTRQEGKHFWEDIPNFFPEIYESFKNQIPDSALPPGDENMLELIQSQNKPDRDIYSKLISRFEYKASGLNIPDSVLDKYYGSDDNLNEISTCALIETFYAKNNFFLEEDQLMRDIYKIKNIPTIIINGRYDMICPPVTAFNLHLKLPLSRLIIAEEAGHSMDEKPIEKELLKAMQNPNQE